MAITTAVLALTVKSFKPELGMQTALAGGVLILGVCAAELTGTARTLREMLAGTGVDGGVISLVFKVTGIAFTAQIASDICRDAGESALASKVQICGRLMMVSAALPMLTELVLSVTRLIGDFL